VEIQAIVSDEMITFLKDDQDVGTNCFRTGRANVAFSVSSRAAIFPLRTLIGRLKECWPCDFEKPED
jgi:hypothetical protein